MSADFSGLRSFFDFLGDLRGIKTLRFPVLRTKLVVIMRAGKPSLHCEPSLHKAGVGRKG